MFDQRDCASAYAQSEVLARRISFEGFQSWVKDFPQIGVSLVSALGRAASLKSRSTTERLDNRIGSKHDLVMEDMPTKAEITQQAILDGPEERIDGLLYALANAFAEQAEVLAEAAVKETEIGNVIDKTLKNRYGLAVKG